MANGSLSGGLTAWCSGHHCKRVWNGVRAKGEQPVVRVVAADRTTRSDSARAVELASTVSSVPHARQLVAEDLANAHLPSTIIENTLIVVTELVTNAILHARPLPLDDARSGVVLRWAVLGHDVLIDVSDGGGSARPQLRPPSMSGDDGRGLSIVNALAREWDIRAEPGRVTVHAVVGPWKQGR